MGSDKILTWLGKLMAISSLFGSKGAKVEKALEQTLESFLAVRDVRTKAKECLATNEALVLSTEELVALDDLFDDVGSALSRLNIKK